LHCENPWAIKKNIYSDILEVELLFRVGKSLILGKAFLKSFNKVNYKIKMNFQRKAGED